MATRYMNDIGQHYTAIGWKRKGIDPTDDINQDILVEYTSDAYSTVWKQHNKSNTYAGKLNGRTLKKFLDDQVNIDILYNAELIKSREELS